MAWETVAKVEVEEEEVAPANWTTVAKVDEPEEDSKPFSFSEDVAPDLIHAIPKGYAKLVAGMADLPNLASTVATYPQRKILNMYGVPEEYTDKVVVPSFSESETMNAPRDSLAGIDMAGRSITELLNKTEGVEEGDFADYAQKGVEWGGAGPISAARKGVTAAPDIAMGIGAPIGAWLGDQLDETAGKYGEIAGGLTGLVSSLRKGKGVGDAVRVIKDSMWGDSAEVIEEVSKRVDAKEKGTLADLSGDQGLADLEAGTVGGPSRQNYVETDLARQQQIADEIREPFGTADPKTARATGQAEIDRRIEEAIPKYVESRQNRVEIPLRAEQQAAEAANEIPQAAAVEAGLNKVRAQQRAEAAAGNTVEAAREAEAARAAFESTETLAESSIKGSEAWKSAKAADKADNVAPKWKEFDAIESIDSTGYRATVDGFIDGLPESQKAQFKMFGFLTEPFSNKKVTTMKPKQIQNYIKDISRELNKPRGGNRSAAHDDLQELYDSLRKKLGTDVPVFDEAMQAEAAWKTRFDAGGVVDEAASRAPELFFKAAGEGDEAGAVAARILKAAKIPGMLEVQAGRLRALARRFKGGTPDEQFVMEYESIMNSLPADVRNQAQAVIDTGRAREAAGAAQTAADDVATAAGKQVLTADTAAEISAKATKGEVARLEKAIARQQDDVAKTGTRLERSVAKSNLNKYVKNRKATLRRMLKNPDDVSDLVELKRNMERLGETDSFNANMADVILETLSDTASGEAGLALASGRTAPLKADAIPKFETIAESLTEAGTDPTVIQEMRTAVLKLSTTQQKAAARQAMMNREHVLQNIIESGASALGLKLAPGSSLVWSGTIRKAVRSLMGRGGSRDKAMMQAIDDFMLNPENYLEAVLAADSPAKGQQILMSELVATSQAYAQD